MKHELFTTAKSQYSMFSPQMLDIVEMSRQNDLFELKDDEIEENFKHAINILWYQYLFLSFSKEDPTITEGVDKLRYDISACAAYILRRYGNFMSPVIRTWEENTPIPLSDFSTCIVSAAMELVHSGDLNIKALFDGFFKKWEKKEYKRFKKYSSVTYSTINSLIDESSGYPTDIEADLFMARSIVMIYVHGGSFDDISKRQIILAGKDIFKSNYDVTQVAGPKEKKEIVENTGENVDKKLDLYVSKLFNENYDEHQNLMHAKFAYASMMPDDISRYQILPDDKKTSIRKLACASLLAEGADIEGISAKDVECRAFAIFIGREYYHSIASGYTLFMNLYKDGIFEPEWMEGINFTSNSKQDDIVETINITEKDDTEKKALEAEVARLKIELTAETGKKKSLKGIVDNLKGDVSDLRAQLSECKEIIKMLSPDIPEENPVEEEINDSSPELSDNLNTMKAFLSGKQIVFVGGSETFAKKVKAEFPDWQFVDTNLKIKEAKAISMNKDLIVVVASHIPHAMFFSFNAISKKYGIPMYSYRGNNMNKLIVETFAQLEPLKKESA